MSKEPELPLTKSGIEAEINRISREFMLDVVETRGENADRILEE